MNIGLLVLLVTHMILYIYLTGACRTVPVNDGFPVGHDEPDNSAECALVHRTYNTEDYYRVAADAAAGAADQVSAGDKNSSFGDETRAVVEPHGVRGDQKLFVTTAAQGDVGESTNNQVCHTFV